MQDSNDNYYNFVIAAHDDLSNCLHDGPSNIARRQHGWSQICPQFIRNFKASIQ